MNDLLSESMLTARCIQGILNRISFEKVEHRGAVLKARGSNMIVLYIVAGLIFLMGLGIRVFQWDFLISGFNMMSKKQKERVDRAGLCRATGNFLILIALLILGGGLAGNAGYRLLSTILLLGILPLTLLYIIRAQKFDANEKNASSKTEMKVGIGIVLFSLLIASAIFFMGAREPKVEMSEDRIRIQGMYGSSIPIHEMTQVQLVEDIPEITEKNNGFDLGYILRGNFTLEGMGQGRIYIHENRPPFIDIRTRDHFYIINFKNPESTKALYEQIVDGMQ